MWACLKHCTLHLSFLVVFRILDVFRNLTAAILMNLFAVCVQPA